jgi:hypothetical protein
MQARPPSREGSSAVFAAGVPKVLPDASPRRVVPKPLLSSGESRSIQVEPRIEDSEVRRNRHRVCGFARTRPLGGRATIASKDL